MQEMKHHQHQQQQQQRRRREENIVFTEKKLLSIKNVFGCLEVSCDNKKYDHDRKKVQYG